MLSLLAVGVCLGLAWGLENKNELVAVGDLPAGVDGNPNVIKCTKDRITADFYFTHPFNGEFFTTDKEDDGITKKCLLGPGDYSYVDFGAKGEKVTASFDVNDGCLIVKDHVRSDAAACADVATPTKDNGCLVPGYTITVYMRFWRPDVDPDTGKRFESVHTKIDSVFEFICLPQPGEEDHSAEILVVEVEPEVVYNNFTAKPECYYCITDQVPSPDGPDGVVQVCPPENPGALEFGEKIYHEVHCEENDHWEGAYCLQVDSAIASAVDTNDPSTLDAYNSIQIISNDCTLDDKLIGNFTFSTSTWGFAPSHPFHIGHPDDSESSVTVYFYITLSYYPSDKDDNCVPAQGCQDEDYVPHVHPSRPSRRKRRAAGHPFAKKMTIKNLYKFKKNSWTPHLTL